MSTKTEIKVPTVQAVKVDEKTATRFILVHGDKGGVGKSFVAQALADFFLKNGEQVAIIDADTQNPDVYRMFSKHMPCAQANIREENGWMDVMDFVESHPGHTIILNTPAGIGEYMKDELATFARYLQVQDVPAQMELWWTMNANHDSVNLFAKAYEKHGHLFTKIRVICNLHFTGGSKEAFVLWDETPLRTRLEKIGGKTIYFPDLHIRIVAKALNPAHIMPFTHAIDAAGGEEVGLLKSESFKFQTWLLEISNLFTSAFDASPAK